jgi:hypothetical protein
MAGLICTRQICQVCQNSHNSIQSRTLVANPRRAADRPAGGWPPEGHIVMPSNYYPFSVSIHGIRQYRNMIGELQNLVAYLKVKILI